VLSSAVHRGMNRLAESLARQSQIASGQGKRVGVRYYPIIAVTGLISVRRQQPRGSSNNFCTWHLRGRYYVAITSDPHHVTPLKSRRCAASRKGARRERERERERERGGGGAETKRGEKMRVPRPLHSSLPAIRVVQRTVTPSSVLPPRPRRAALVFNRERRGTNRKYTAVADPLY